MNTSARGPASPGFVWRAARRHVTTYALAVGAPLLAVVLTCSIGWRLFGATSPPPSELNLPTHTGPLLDLLVALTTILVASRLSGAAFVRLRQPRVMGEIVAGIALGPSLLGAVAPAVAAILVSPSVHLTLVSIGQLGLILFMFLVGLEFDPGLMRRRGHVALVVSHTSICVPFLGGTVLGLGLYASWYRGDVPFLPFVLFMGLAMSVTAFPVLTRILCERRMQATPLGALALACAAADDITAWCLLAALVGLANADPGAGLTSVLGSVAFGLVMWGVIRPLLKRLCGGQPMGLSTQLLGLFCSALAAEWVGIHAFFGAFLFGLCVPRNSAAAVQVKDKLEDFTCSLLMPAFFVISGMRTEFGSLSGFDDWLICGLVIAVATAGKLIGAVIPARATGLSWHESLRLGILMNTRGLMEIVIANIGLECGLIPPKIFTVLVVMALVTTLATGPLLNVFERWPGGRRSKGCLKKVQRQRR
jgi:Kef-type K+ transport system membrane component KefB